MTKPRRASATTTLHPPPPLTIASPPELDLSIRVAIRQLRMAHTRLSQLTGPCRAMTDPATCPTTAMWRLRRRHRSPTPSTCRRRPSRTWSYASARLSGQPWLHTPLWEAPSTALPTTGHRQHSPLSCRRRGPPPTHAPRILLILLTLILILILLNLIILIILIIQSS